MLLLHGVDIALSVTTEDDISERVKFCGIQGNKELLTFGTLSTLKDLVVQSNSIHGLMIAF